MKTFVCVSFFLVFGMVQLASADLPVTDIQTALGAEGQLSNGVLIIPILRTDIGNVASAIGGVTLTPDFGIHGEVYFQSLKSGNTFMNGEMALLNSETDHFISVLATNKLVFQGFEQHMPMHPMVWYVHFRGEGDAVKLATALRAAIDETTTPLPQTLPANPTTPLDVQKLADALHGTAFVGGNGVVTVTVPRTKKVVVEGVKVKSDAGTAAMVELDPVDSTTTAVIVRFAMIATEVNPVVNVMRNTLKWHQGSLYSQEIKEKPQLYYTHMFKTGDAYALAGEIRQGLDLTASN